MGIYVDALFTKTQQRVLAVLFGQSQRSFYANEIIGLATHPLAEVVERNNSVVVDGIDADRNLSVNELLDIHDNSASD